MSSSRINSSNKNSQTRSSTKKQKTQISQLQTPIQKQGRNINLNSRTKQKKNCEERQKRNFKQDFAFSSNPPSQRNQKSLLIQQASSSNIRNKSNLTQRNKEVKDEHIKQRKQQQVRQNKEDIKSQNSTPRFNKNQDIKQITNDKCKFHSNKNLSFTLNDSNVENVECSNPKELQQQNFQLFQDTEPSFGKGLVFSDNLLKYQESFDDKMTEKNYSNVSIQQQNSSNYKRQSPNILQENSSFMMTSEDSRNFIMNEMNNLKQELHETKALLNNTLAQLSKQNEQQKENVIIVDNLDPDSLKFLKGLHRLPKNKIAVSQSSKCVKAPNIKRKPQKYEQLQLAFEKFINTRQL